MAGDARTTSAVDDPGGRMTDPNDWAAPGGADDGPRHWTLYAYTIRPASFIQAVFMAASPDPDWALSAWRSLRYAPTAT